MEYSGVWDVVSGPGMEPRFRQPSDPSYVKLTQIGQSIDGEYQFGEQMGSIDGRIEENGRIIFSFAGLDELDEVNGAGTAVLQGDALTLTLMYHYGDDITFECRRQV